MNIREKREAVGMTQAELAFLKANRLQGFHPCTPQETEFLDFP